MDASNKKNSKSALSLRSHIIAALLSSGAAAILLWLASGMSLAAVIVDSFNLGFYIGFMLLMSAAPAVLASPIILPGLLLTVSGLLLGVSAVAFAFKLKSIFGLTQNKSGNSLTRESSSEDKSELLIKHDDLNNQSSNLGKGKDSSLKKKYDYIRYWGSLSLTSFVSSGATALLGWFATDLVVSLSIIPVFLTGMTLAIVLVPLSIALSGVFALPAFTALMFTLGGFSVGSVAAALTSYFLSDGCAQDNGVKAVIEGSKDNSCENQESHKKMLHGLKSDKLSSNEELINSERSEQTSRVSKITKDDNNSIKEEEINAKEEYSFCGLKL